MPQQTEVKQAPPQRFLKKLTSAEMVERRARGLCFNCDEIFTRGHVCKPSLFQIVLVNDGANQYDEPFEEDDIVDGAPSRGGE